MAYFADRINRLLPGYEKHIVRINTLLNDEKYLKKVPVLFLQIMSVRQFMFHLLFWLQKHIYIFQTKKNNMDRNNYKKWEFLKICHLFAFMHEILPIWIN